MVLCPVRPRRLSPNTFVILALYAVPPLAQSSRARPPDDAKHVEDPTKEVYVKDIARGQICAFMIGYSTYLKETEVAAKSVLTLMPGVRVAIATHPDELSDFSR